MSDLIGHKLGQYEITGLVGKGGMSTVYLARQGSVGRTVAVKVLPPHLMHDDSFLKRFQREVQAVARMQHPRIIPVHDYGEEQGVPYIVMAHIEGGSLSERIKAQGPLPLDETLRLVAQIAEGLDYAHNQGVIHRDFKPSNVLLDAGGNAYLSDFGIAKVSQETVQLTGSGIVGTPTYMAPEMFKQEAATPAVDIYALGVTLYQMLSGDAPYSGTTPVQLMYAHLNEPVPSIEAARKDVPPEVQIVLDRAMAKNPSDRYATARQMAEELKMAADGDLPIPASPPVAMPTPTPAPMPTRQMDEAALAPAVRAAKPQDKPVKKPVKQEEIRQKPRRRNMWVVWIILIVFGGLALCRGAGTIGNAISSFVTSLAGDSSGLDGPLVREQISQPLNEASSLEVKIQLGTGQIDIDALTNSTLAAQGEYSGKGDVGIDQSYELFNGKGVLTLSQRSPNPNKTGILDSFQLQLTDAVPIDLSIEAGAGGASLDLTGLQISGLELKGGIGKYEIILPRSGSFDVDVNAGVGDTLILIPDSVEARITVSGGPSNITVGDQRFTSNGNNVWESSGYQSAIQRIRVNITAGLGNITIDREP